MPYIFKIPTYTCYICSWYGRDDTVGKIKSEDDEGEFNTLHCPQCCNQLLSIEYEKVNKWVDEVDL